MLEKFIASPWMGLWSKITLRSYHLALSLVGVFTLAVAALLIHAGAPPMFAMPWDVMVVLDDAWRVLNGQIPNVDFMAVIPPLTIELTVFGMSVAPPSASALTYGSVLLFVLVTGWAWWIARARLSAGLACLFTLYVGVLVVAPRALSDGIQATSYAMLYNRQGWALVSLVFLQALAPSRRAKGLGEGVSAGALLGLLLFSKLSYFFMGAGAVLLGLLLGRTRRVRFLVGLAASGLAVVTLAEGVLQLSVTAYLAEIKAIAAVYNQLKPIRVVHVLIMNAQAICLAVAPVLLLMLVEELRAGRDVWRRRWPLLLGTGFVVAANVLLCSTNSQSTEMPLAVAALLALEAFRQEFRHRGNALNSPVGLAYLTSLVLVVPMLLLKPLSKDLASLAFVQGWRYWEQPTLPEAWRFQSGPLFDFVVPESPVIASKIAPAEDAASRYTHEVNDGLALLRKHIGPSSRILALDFANPFPFALALPAPKGDLACWSFGGSFNREHFPDAARIFSDADMVMIPKSRQRKLDTVETLKELYGPYLAGHFAVADESENWTLLIAQPSLASAGKAAPVE